MDTNIENLENAESAENTEATENAEITENTEINENTEAAEDKSDKTGNTPNNSMPEKTEIVGVRFKKEGKTYYFAPNGFTLKKDDRIIVDTSRGLEYGYTAVPNTVVKTSELVMPLRGVVRLATEEDTRVHSENLKREIEAYNACIALIDEHNPKMKLIDVECAFDRSKLLFYFSAEERVDFREIVKALANTFHTRIEMRQIGIRDEAKMLGGLGVCGRPFCCSSFLTDFVQVSVKMAKEQNISLNAAKISGACGKLMCCLRYEYETYLSEKAITPKVGVRVMTPDGPGEVTESNPLAGIVKVRLDGKAEDAEQTVYIREDVVKEEEYSGEQLTKTEIPKRGKTKEEEDAFASFASAVSEEADTPSEAKKEAAEPSGDKPQNNGQNKNTAHDKNGAKNTAQDKNHSQDRNNAQVKNNMSQPKKENSDETSDATSEKAENRSGNNNRRRKKHKGHNSGQGGGQNQGGTQGQNAAQGQNGGQNQGQGSGQNQGAAQPQSQNKGQQQNKNGGAPVNQNNRGSQNGQGGQNNHNKKKHFKPYHKRFDNNGNKGGGQSGEKQ